MRIQKLVIAATLAFCLQSMSTLAKDRKVCNELPLDSVSVREAGAAEWGTQRYENGVSWDYCEAIRFQLVSRPLPTKPTAGDAQYPFGCCTVFDCKNVPINRFDNEQVVCTATKRYVVRGENPWMRAACSKAKCYSTFVDNPDLQLIGEVFKPLSRKELEGLVPPEMLSQVTEGQGQPQQVTEPLTPDQRKALEAMQRAMETMTPEQRAAIVEMLKKQAEGKQ